MYWQISTPHSSHISRWLSLSVSVSLSLSLPPSPSLYADAQSTALCRFRDSTLLLLLVLVRLLVTINSYILLRALSHCSTAASAAAAVMTTKYHSLSLSQLATRAGGGSGPLRATVRLRRRGLRQRGNHHPPATQRDRGCASPSFAPPVDAHLLSSC